MSPLTRSMRRRSAPRQTAGSERGPDQVLVAAHGGFGLVALAMPSRALPGDAAAVGHDLDVAVARGLLVRIGGARHGVGPGRDDHGRR